MKEIAAERLKPIRLQPRDLKIMSLMHEYPFLTMQDVKDLFWKGSGICNHSARLRLLEKHGYIERLEVMDSGDPAFRLSHKGCVLLRRMGQVKPEKRYRRKAYANQFNHDKLLGRILRRFSSQPFVAFTETEEDIRVRYRQKVEAFRTGYDEFKIPDGRIVLEASSGIQIGVAIELELTLKSRRSYESIFSDYQKLSDWQILLYIVDNPASAKRLSEICEEVFLERGGGTALFENAPVFITTVDQVMNAPFDGTWSVRGKAVKLSEIVNNWPFSNPYGAV